jgi:hypothetical protein
LLGSEGSYKKGSDKFYTMYVYGGDATNDALNLTHAMFHEHTIPNEDDIEINIQLEDVRVPIIDTYTLPDVILTKHTYTMSEESYADTSWKSADYGEDRSQKLLYDNVDIFDGHQLIDTVYTWGEIDDREASNNTSDSYSYESAGDYTIRITVREKWNTQTMVEKDIRVKYNEPDVDFSWTPTETSEGKIKGQEEITFSNDTTDLDDRTATEYTFKWEIEDTNQDDSDNSDEYTDKDVDFDPTKKFQSEGSKTVTLTCYWNDGFDDQSVSISKEIVIYPYTITSEFTWNNPVDRTVDVELTDTTVDNDSRVSEIKFHVDDYYEKYNPDNADYGNSEPDNAEDWDGLVLGDKVTHKFQAKTGHVMRVTATYNDGWKDVDQSKEHTLAPTEHILEAKISNDPVNSAMTFYGKNEYTWVNDSDGDASDRQIDADWSWNDKEGDTDHVTTREDEVWDTAQKFTFQYASRKPYTAIDGATDSNFNKEVSMTVRYDNGWNDVTTNSTSVVAEASTYEVDSSSISYEENVEGYGH